jgi:hypothetical protein
VTIFQTQAPAAVSAAGVVLRFISCPDCTCFEGNNDLCRACETCGDCHACLLCGREHAAPKNGACPEPRITVRKTGRIWYAECPLTLTGDCNPSVGCEGDKDLAPLHSWAMRHVAKHKAERR